MKEYEVRLECRGLSGGYGKEKVIDHVDLKLRKGEIIVLLGPNGSGKSTLLKTIAGQLGPLAGTVYLSGKDMSEMTAGERALKVSSLFTERPRSRYMTCFDVAAGGRYPYTGRLGILSGADREKVLEAMEKTGAAALCGIPFENISDGQKQRVLIARALCQEPEILILDEPASYLDIRYQLELSKTLKKLAGSEGLSVIVSFHELDLAKRTGDIIVCIKDGKVDRAGTPDEIFSSSYPEELFDLPPGSLTKSGIGSDNTGFDVSKGGRRLRKGITTGTCAALASLGAAQVLVCGLSPRSASLVTPGGMKVCVPLIDTDTGDGYAICGVKKDAGDDPDITDGAVIFSKVSYSDRPGIVIDGGAGVGRVTKAGLDREIGEAAINTIPRKMIEEAVRSAAEDAGYTGGLKVEISVPGGEELAKKTFNERLGIEGGISILGTSGIVEPMSSQALVDTIHLEIRQKAAAGHTSLILTPGNYGRSYIGKNGLDSFGIPVTVCSNFIGDALSIAENEGFKEILLVGHIGKLVKLAGNIMNTHSKYADCRREIFCSRAALCGAPQDVFGRIMDAATADECITALKEHGLEDTVMDSIIKDACKAVRRKIENKDIICGIVMFSDKHGREWTDPDAVLLIDKWRSRTDRRIL